MHQAGAHEELLAGAPRVELDLGAFQLEVRVAITELHVAGYAKGGPVADS